MAPQYGFRPKEWIGNAIAQVLELDAEDQTDRQTIKQCVKIWTDSGALRVVKIHDDKSKERPVVEVGEWAV